MRGGKREGAGRLPDVSAEYAAFIRKDCEQRANEQLRTQAEKRIKRQLESRGVLLKDEEGPKDNKGEYRDLCALGRDDWEDDRLAKYRKENNPKVWEYGFNPEKRIPDDIPEDVEIAINAVRNNRKLGVTGKSYSAPFPQQLSNGQRKKIMQDVARDHGVSERTVRTIWERKP